MSLTFNDVLMVPQYSEVDSRYNYLYLDLNAKSTHTSHIEFHLMSPSSHHLWIQSLSIEWLFKWLEMEV